MSRPEKFSLGSVHVALTPLERFQEFLENRGKRLTAQRRIILDRVFSRHEHFEADELVEELAHGHSISRVSRPTVYRTLNEMVKARMLRRLDLSGRAVYEHDYGYPQHDHLHCQTCGKLIEFQSDELRRLRDAVARNHRFLVSGHRLIVTGVCQDCLAGPTTP